MINKTFSHETIAKEIMDKISTMGDFTEKQIKNHFRDYDLFYEFDLKNGICEENNRKPNTVFYFDSPISSETYQYIKYMYSHEETKESKEKEEDFINSVAKEIEGKYTDVIRDVIWQNIKVPKEILPLKIITINLIELVDYSSVPELQQNTFVIKKYKDKQEEKIDVKEVLKVISDEADKDPNVTLEYITAKHHTINTESFKNIETIQKGMKYLWNTVVHAFIDYSFVEVKSVK